MVREGGREREGEGGREREGGRKVLPDFDVVRKEPAVDGFGGVSHEHSAFECGLQHGGQAGGATLLTPHYSPLTPHTTLLTPHLLQEPWQSSTVVQMEAVHTDKSMTNAPLPLPPQAPTASDSSLCDEEEVDLLRLNHVRVGQSVHPREARVDTAVQLEGGRGRRGRERGGERKGGREGGRASCLMASSKQRLLVP